MKAHSHGQSYRPRNSSIPENSSTAHVAVALSPAPEGIQKESHPPMHWVTGMQTSGLAMDPEVARELAPVPQL